MSMWTYRGGKNIAQVLGMTVREAREFFANEPSVLRSLQLLQDIGLGYLHAADVDKLMTQLNTLVDAGNTVVVVEHDMRVVAASDWVIDMGPGAGDQGGRIVASGTPDKIAQNSTSRTARYLGAITP
jgi:excinuclease ABC subunit A